MDEVTRIAPANLTLTVIRETVVALAERATSTALPTAGPTRIEATAKPTVTATELEPLLTEAVASATHQPTVDVATEAPRIAPANVTLTAIRETVVGLRS